MRSRNKRFSLWLNDDEFSHLTKQADLAGLKKEPFLRKLIMKSEVYSRPPDEYRLLLREINAIGNNINQIAHIANSERHISDEKIDETIKLLYEIMTLERGRRYGYNQNMDGQIKT